MMRQLALAAMAAIALLGSHLCSERAAAAKNATADPDALRYLPEGRILKIVSLGHSNLLADLVWLQAIQYYGEQRLTTRNYDQTERFFTAIYDLDSSFMPATRFGALVLSQDAGDPTSALALLDRASVDHPMAWQYPFDQGFIYQTILKDYREAGLAYRRAADKPGAPELAHQLAGVSFARLGDRDSAREIWRSLLEDSNSMTRAVAERNLRNLDLDEREQRLTEAVHSYRVDHGRIPANWDELRTSGHVAQFPEDPWGGQFFWVPENDEVLASTTIDRRMAAIRNLMQGTVDSFEKTEGRRPASLVELTDAGRIERPWGPFGLTFDYDPVTGHVSWNPPWSPTEATKSSDGGAA